MLPRSYDKVCLDTKHTTQLFIARSCGVLQGRGMTDEEIRAAMEKIEKEAIKEAVQMTVEEWKKRRQLCTAEQFVRMFADLVWEAARGQVTDSDGLWPYEFKTPVDEGGPLSIEFLEGIGISEAEARASPQAKKNKGDLFSTMLLEAVAISEAEARANPQAKKDKGPQNKQSSDKLQSIPEEPQSHENQRSHEKQQSLEKHHSPEKRRTTEKEQQVKNGNGPQKNGQGSGKLQTPEEPQGLEKHQVPGWRNTSAKEQSPEKKQTPAEDANFSVSPEPFFQIEEPGSLESAILNTLDVEKAYESRKKRKNGEPATPVPKRQRGNDGEKVPTGSFTQLPTHLETSGAALTPLQIRQMNAGLMEAIWETRIYDGDNTYHGGGVFAVKIPKDKALQVLVRHLNLIHSLIWSRWRPVKLYTCDLGRELQVGLWVPKLESQGQMEEVVRYKSEELYNLLRLWSCQIRGSGTQNFANYLVGYFKHLGLR